MVDDRSVPQAEIDGDRGVIEANAERLLRLLLTLPGRRDDALAIVNGFFGDRLADQGWAQRSAPGISRERPRSP